MSDTEDEGAPELLYGIQTGIPEPPSDVNEPPTFGALFILAVIVTVSFCAGFGCHYILAGVR